MLVVVKICVCSPACTHSQLANARAKAFIYFCPALKLKGKSLESYVLIKTEPGMIWHVAEAALMVEGVKMAHAVTGQFDAVAYVEFPKMEDLGRIIDEIQHLKGVLRTQTLTVIPPTIRKL